jgi:hypothetical protein
MHARVPIRIVKATVFRQASFERLQDAKCLHKAGRFQGAIYLCGYALECQLKANVCTARRVESLEEREAKNLGHELANVLDAAQLSVKLIGNEDLRTAFYRIANRWSTGIRYSGGRSNKQECRRFIKDSEFLLSWLKTESKS